MANYEELYIRLDPSTHRDDLSNETSTAVQNLQTSLGAVAELEIELKAQRDINKVQAKKLVEIERSLQKERMEFYTITNKLQERNGYLEVQARTFEEKNTALETEMAATRSKLAHAERESLVDIQTRIAREEELETLREKTQAYETEIRRLQAELNDVASLKTRFKEVDQWNSFLMSSVEAERKEREKVSAIVEQLVGEKQNLINQLQASATNAQGLSKALEGANQKLAAAGQKIEAAITKIGRLETRIHELEKELGDARTAKSKEEFILPPNGLALAPIQEAIEKEVQKKNDLQAMIRTEMDNREAALRTEIEKLRKDLPLNNALKEKAAEEARIRAQMADPQATESDREQLQAVLDLIKFQRLQLETSAK